MIDKIKELIASIADRRKLYIVDVTYKREGKRMVLRVVADKSGGINMDECARLNNELSELLDKESVIEEQYTLEVVSPGLDKKLKKDTDFIWALGRKVRVTMYAPIDGKSAFSGVLVGLGDGTVVVDEEGTATEIPREKIASARLTYE